MNYRKWKKLSFYLVQVRCRIFIYALLLVFLVIFWSAMDFLVLFVQENQMNNVAQRILDDGFAGTSLCGEFSCFGEALCKSKNKHIVSVQLHHLSAKIEKDWYCVDGITIDKYRRRNNVTFKVALSKTCSSSSCYLRLTRDVFSEANYRARICNAFGMHGNCDVPAMFSGWTKMVAVLKSQGRLNPDYIRGLSRPLTCATARLADRVVRRVLDARDLGSISLRDFTSKEKARLLFVSKMAPGIVVQSLFPANEGWLFEPLAGACGNVVVQSTAVVRTLYEMYHAPWDVRVDLAIQLLTMAHHFTDNDSKFMLLFHKLTVHDLGISLSGKLRVRNGDDVIIVDQSDIEQKHHSSDDQIEVSYNKHDMSVNEENFCFHSRNDVNYYVTCRYFLGGTWTGLNGESFPGGLLHDPKDLSSFATRIYVLLDICQRGPIAVPPGRRSWATPIRAVAASQLRKLLLKRQKCDARFAYRYPECEYMDGSNAMYKVPEFELKWIR